jgi:hypothetical protein
MTALMALTVMGGKKKVPLWNPQLGGLAEKSANCSTMPVELERLLTGNPRKRLTGGTKDLRPEAAHSISPCVDGLKIKEWLKEKHPEHWAATPDMRQSKLLIEALLTKMS